MASEELRVASVRVWRAQVAKAAAVQVCQRASLEMGKAESELRGAQDEFNEACRQLLNLAQETDPEAYAEAEKPGEVEKLDAAIARHGPEYA